MTKMLLMLMTLGMLFTSPASAASYAGTCTTSPKAEWMSLADVQTKLTEAGYTVKSIKETRAGNCYEAYVTDKSGTKMELFLDPVTAKIVHKV